MERRSRLRLLVVGGALAAVVATAAYWSLRSDCVAAGPGIRGAVKVLADRKVLYFNGSCWTRKPITPRDMPF